MQKRTIINICLISLFVLSILWVIGRWHTEPWQKNPMYPLVSILLLAVWGGVMFVTIILPGIGDAVGTVMYSSGEAVTKSEGMQAAAKMAAGDYEGAIGHYEKMLEDKPDDPFPVAEIAKIHAERLHDPHSALAALSNHLQIRDWPVDDAAFIMFRISEVYMTHLHDFGAARDMLEQVIGNFPNTRHSANAHHKVTEIEQAEFAYLQSQRAKAAAASAEQQAS